MVSVNIRCFHTFRGLPLFFRHCLHCRRNDKLGGRAGSRPRQVRPRPKAPPKKEKFLRKKGPTFHS